MNFVLNFLIFNNIITLFYFNIINRKNILRIYLSNKKGPLAKSLILLFYRKSPPILTNSGANTSETTVISFISMFSDGPEVSLNGSPTVSPVTAAL